MNETYRYILENILWKQTIGEGRDAMKSKISF
jgi:hypothetical protein